MEVRYFPFPSPTHLTNFRNFGILVVFTLGLMTMYLLATEFITAKKSKGEVLVFRRGHMLLKTKHSDDVEAASGRQAVTGTTEVDHSAVIERQTAIFQWKDVCYDIKIKGQPRRILDHVDGWVKPGTLTALMVSCLLDELENILINLPRVSLALEKRLCWIVLPLVPPWESLPVKC